DQHREEQRDARENQPWVVAERAPLRIGGPNRRGRASWRNRRNARGHTCYSVLASRCSWLAEGSVLRVEEIFQLVGELVDVAEVPIHRGEPDVRDLIELLQFFHDEGADLR